MPITAPIITSAILAAAPDLTGSSWALLAAAVGQAVQAWAILPLNVTLTGVVTGTVGGGSVTGKIFIPPSPLPLPATTLAAGFAGLKAPRIAAGIGIGVSTALNASGAYLGVTVGACGADVSKIVFVNPASLTGILIGCCNANGLNGPQTPLLASGIANGIATMFLTGTGIGTAIGFPGPVPGAGLSRSKLW